ncbi:MAG TPA: DUF2867 domain-containing protein [Aquabacterium sp.]|uniref:DUF2867 domain-containing protein n=1 Tax=Aquabacterium sp. TaxID=1872578 RepID=UPI002E3396CA|nr:DUF2867 domain-containing protein [Aquabacterium sp.]HEX5357385.1 DUF2867 domain-containing protein [Aquabacterium sp.]
MRATICEVPSFSVLKESLPTAYFHDCYAVKLPQDDRTPLELYLSVVSRTPRWIDFLMNTRNKIVAQIGLKDMGPLSGVDRSKPASAYRVGDQAGIFKLMTQNDREVILGETDKHLDVKISVARQECSDGITVYVSTVVHVHNALGRLYMLFVTPAHRVIAPATVSRLALV